MVTKCGSTKMLGKKKMVSFVWVQWWTKLWVEERQNGVKKICVEKGILFRKIFEVERKIGWKFFFKSQKNFELKLKILNQKNFGSKNCQGGQEIIWVQEKRLEKKFVLKKDLGRKQSFGSKNCQQNVGLLWLWHNSNLT